MRRLGQRPPARARVSRTRRRPLTVTNRDDARIAATRQARALAQSASPHQRIIDNDRLRNQEHDGKTAPTLRLRLDHIARKAPAPGEQKTPPAGQRSTIDHTGHDASPSRRGRLRTPSQPQPAVSRRQLARWLWFWLRRAGSSPPASAVTAGHHRADETTHHPHMRPQPALFGLALCACAGRLRREPQYHLALPSSALMTTGPDPSKPTAPRAGILGRVLTNNELRDSQDPRSRSPPTPGPRWAARKTPNYRSISPG